MTIVLISPKKIQKTLITVSIVVSAVVLLAVIGAVFLPALTQRFGGTPPPEIPVLPHVTIDFSALDSPQVQQLQNFPGIQKEFSYTAQNTSGKEVKGNIFASTTVEAEQLLQSQGLTAKSVEEASRGRSEPFVPYYAPGGVKK